MNSIDPRSISERGRIAERMPIGIAISRQRIIPPITSDAVMGSVSLISSVTASSERVESPRSACTTTRSRKPKYSLTNEPRRLYVVCRSVPNPCWLRCALVESPGRTKNITNAISVITKKSISAHTSRLKM